jgi:CxxC motif-containing protein (DUF1111 family)
MSRRGARSAGSGASAALRPLIALAVLATASGCAFDDASEGAGYGTDSSALLDRVLEVENAVRTGTLDRAWGAIMDSAGDRVCWSGIDMAGVDRANVRYSSGEGLGDSLALTYNGISIATLNLPNCITNGAWEGDCGDVLVDFAPQSGSGSLCLVGAGPGWIGAINRLEIDNACAGAGCGGSGTESIVIRTNRGQRYLTVGADGYLGWSASERSGAAVFDKVEANGTRFKLRAQSTGNFVRLDAADDLIADASQAGAALFDAAVCVAPFVGLQALGDSDGANFVAAEDSGRLRARTTSCGAGDPAAWEKFEIIAASATPPDPDPDPDPPPPGQDPGNIVPLFDQNTAREPDIVINTPTALITRFADRGRDRHARESVFASYEHYLTWYWEDRTAGVTITDTVGRGGSEIRFDVVMQHKLGARELRMGFMGRNTVAEYCDNSPLIPAHPDGREMSLAEHAASPPDGLHYYFKVVRQHQAPITCAVSPLGPGQKIEFEMSQFLDTPPNGRENYYGTTFLYVVGEGIKAWEATGPLGSNNLGGMFGIPADSMPIPVSALLGGRTTTHRSESGEPDNVFMQMATNLAPQNGQRFVLGRRVLHTDFVNGEHDEPGNPAWNAQSGKGGPLLINRTCNSCHTQNARALPAAIGQRLDKWVFKVGDAQGNAHPNLGTVLQTSSTIGASEGNVTIGSYTESNGLRRPNFVFSGANPARFSARISPQLVGMGLLEAIPETAVLALADPNDANGDGISGRANTVNDSRGIARLGRFGWKASMPDVRHQVAGALRTDMGVLTSVFSSPDCGSAQSNCGPSGAELSDNDLSDLIAYTSLLGVQPQTGHESSQVRSGAEVFERIGCARCHTTTFQTSVFAPFAEVRGQTIHPYTDLLLHDMGPGLADNLAEGNAAGAEWRTAPLWGIGKTFAMHGGQEAYLHDGRARSLEEAIRWHGGEGQAANDRFGALSTGERDALIAFLRSL